MPEPDETPPAQPDLSLPTELGNLDPGELLARGMQSAKMSGGGAHGWMPPTPEEVAHLFPNYEILSMLGRGGMGAVYKARQTALDRLVAIKLLPLEISVDQAFADRFRREARAMAKLNHPHIIAVHDFGQTSEGHLFFAMEFVEGANLHDIIHGPGLAPDQALVIAAQICTALAYAHGKGVVHRDIKPANVMLDTESQVKVADFGLARLTDASSTDFGTTLTGTVMGTPDYMAPEQMKGMNVDHRADIYSLGVMLYEMLCRETPRGAFDLPSARTGCDPRLDAIVLKAMQPAPERRYQSTVEMKADVDSARMPVEMTPSVVEPVVSAAPRVVEKAAALAPKKNRLPLWIASAIVLVVVFGAAIFGAKRRASPIAEASGAITPKVIAAWTPVALTQDWAAKQGGASLNAAGELSTDRWLDLPGIHARDIAIRGELWLPIGDSSNGIYLRQRPGTTTRFLSVYNHNALLQLHKQGGQFPVLSKLNFPQEMDISGKWVPFEFATVGKTSFARVQSLLLSPGTSDECLDAGTVLLRNITVHKLEIMILDGVPEAQWPEFIRTALKQSGAQP